MSTVSILLPFRNAAPTLQAATVSMSDDPSIIRLDFDCIFEEQPTRP